MTGPEDVPQAAVEAFVQAFDVARVRAGLAAARPHLPPTDEQRAAILREAADMLDAQPLYCETHGSVMRLSCGHPSSLRVAADGLSVSVPRSVVYVTVTALNRWQQSSEAVYGPFTQTEQGAFCDWLANELRDSGYVRIATFPLMPAPPESQPQIDTHRGAR